MNKKLKTIYLVTGASGFVGAALLHRLVKKPNVDLHIIIRKQSKLWRIKDILKQVKVHYDNLGNLPKLKQIIKKIKPDVIYHLAAYGAYANQDDIFQAIKTNIVGTMNLLEACRQNKFKMFVNTGSSSEYGFKKKPMKETDVLEPNSNYAVTKASVSCYCRYLAKQKKLPIVTLRLFSVYGPYEEPTRLVPTLIYKCLEGKLPPLVSPKTARDFIYIEDVLDIYDRIAKTQKFAGEILNVGTGKQVTIKNVVKEATKITRCQAKIKWGSMPGRKWDSNVWVADNSKIKKLLNWKPRYTLKQGLKESVEWFREHQNLYK